MRSTISLLYLLAGTILIIPALFVGSLGYAVGVAFLTAGTILLPLAWLNTSLRNALLLVNCCMATIAIFLGIPLLLLVLSISLYLLAWNTANRFGHLTGEAADKLSRLRLGYRLIMICLLQTAGVALTLLPAIYLRTSLSFSIALTLACCSLAFIAVFLRFAIRKNPQ